MVHLGASEDADDDDNDDDDDVDETDDDDSFNDVEKTGDSEAGGAKKTEYDRSLLLPAAYNPLKSEAAEASEASE